MSLFQLLCSTISNLTYSNDGEGISSAGTVIDAQAINDAPDEDEDSSSYAE